MRELPAAVRPALEVGLLGPFEVASAGRRLDVTGPKRHALLALLALGGGRPVGVDTLVDALWGERLPAAPRNALQHHVARLRAALGPEAIAGCDDGYALEVATVDALEFEELLRASRTSLQEGHPDAAFESAGRALSLWRGTPLLGLPDTPWVRAEGHRLEALHADALEEHFEAALALGRHGEIAPAIRSALAESPFRERLWGQLMLALYRSGRQADALETFQEARQLLTADLGLEPGPELQRLQQAILAQDPTIAGSPTAPRRRVNLPAPVNSFIDREEAMEKLLSMLRDYRLVTLTGPPGVGKSRLALEAAWTRARDVREGIWLVDLERANRDEDVARLVARAIGAGDGDPLGRSCARLRDADALLVLDGCERVVDGAADVARALLAECGGVRVLATSRQVLRVPGEARLTLAPLALGDADPAGAPAVQLFAERARAARPGFELTAQDTALVREICRRLDGLPLAIELAAARVDVLGLREILAAAERRCAVLAAPDRSAPERFRSLELLIAWSYDLLGDDERTLLHELALFRGGAALSAIVTAAARHGLDEATVTHLLSALVDRSIVTASFPGGEPRYDLLETVREYVLDRVTEGALLNAA